MKSLKLKGENFWDTSGVYDSGSRKTQAEINSGVDGLKSSAEAYSLEYNSPDLWTQGVIGSTGAASASTTRLRTNTGVFLKDLLSIETAAGYSFMIVCYDQNGYSITHDGVHTSSYYNQNEKAFNNTYIKKAVFDAADIANLGDYNYLKIILKKDDNATLTPANDYNKIKITPAAPYFRGKNGLSAFWNKNQSTLAWGFTPYNNAVYPLKIDSPLIVDGTIMAINHSGNNQRNRWGLHLFDGFSANKSSRLSMIIDKFTDAVTSKAVTAIYHYKGGSHSAASYAATQIGSDVPRHSFVFDRDDLYANGVIHNAFPLYIAPISQDELIKTYTTVEAADAAIDANTHSADSAKALKYISLLHAPDGAMFYDTDRKKLVCKVNGKWSDVNTTDASSHYQDI